MMMYYFVTANWCRVTSRDELSPFLLHFALQRDGTITSRLRSANISSASYQNKTFYIFSSMFPLKLSINWVYNTFPVSSQYCAVFRFCLLCLFTVFSHCELYCISIMCKFAVLCCYWNNKLDLRPPTQQQWQCFFHLGHVDFILYTTSHIYAFDVTPRLWIVWRIYSQLNQSKSHLNHLNCDIAVIRNKLLP